MQNNKVVLFYFDKKSRELKILLKQDQLPFLPELNFPLMIQDQDVARRLEMNHQCRWHDLFSIDHFTESEGRLVLAELGKFYSFMGRDGSLSEGESFLPHFLLKHRIQDEVTFFGGSFNPWHDGHRACLDLCPEDNIVIVPDSSPWKPLQNEVCFFKSFMELAQKLNCSNYSLFPGFYGQTNPNPTIRWLPKVKISKKNLLMGDDSFINFPKWNQAQELSLHLHKIYVVPRWERREENLVTRKTLQAWNSQLIIIDLPDHEYKSLSSTSLRK